MPQADFYCFQEVWDRFFAAALIRKLKKRLPHFIVDVSKHQLQKQLCLGSKFSDETIGRIISKVLFNSIT